MLSLAFPAIDPVLIDLGPLKVHWYGLAYVVGILAGWKYAVYLIKNYASHLKTQYIDDFITWAVVGAVVGGRLGHILFFDWAHYSQHPLEILMTWKGGMAFHGGLLGVVIAAAIYCYRRSIKPLQFADVIAAASPIGLGLGRVANFVNGELYGRVTDVPWAVRFPQGNLLPRHPSQLYEAFLEGALLWLVLFMAWRFTSLSKYPGRIAGLFMLGYGVARFMIEYVREPDTFYSFFGLDLTTGQVLSLPLIAIGAYWLKARQHECSA